MAARYEIIKMDTHEDFRGELKKVFKKTMLRDHKTIEEIYVLYTNKDCVRGNHYHKQNIEFFAVLKGTATIALKDLENGEAEFIIVSGNDDIVIKVPENVAHGFRNDENEELIILAAASLQYNPEDTDTYAFQLF
jgi:dTDP-4-dehydrorhamnose 3,5-epimerase-like enzyme